MANYFYRSEADRLPFICIDKNYLTAKQANKFPYSANLISSIYILIHMLTEFLTKGHVKRAIVK